MNPKIIFSEAAIDKKQTTPVSVPVLTLVKKYQESLRPPTVSEESKIHVDEIASKVAKFYEKIRKIVDWKEENLLRRNAIERILKRSLFGEFSKLNFIFKNNINSIAESLVDKGYYTTVPLLDQSVMGTLRAQAIALRQEGRYEQSWSERIQEHDGQVIRFDKPGVFACEPDGADYETAPDLVTYMSHLITTLPPALNQHLPENVARISNQAFNAKLAYTESHSEYPLHVDNSLGLNGGDTRKLTCILYLNPEYDRGVHKGELRVHLLNDEFVDLEPSVRFVCFWTDEIPHKVLMTGDSHGMDRYALTIWLADEEPQHIHNSSSKFAELRLHAFD